jgi:L-ascorbate metabolism protein UlaG (beta-lactamase superfamily)
MKLTWLGTAGFRIETDDGAFLIDPYLTRNPEATPVQNIRPDQLEPAGQIFISHGHFDHLLDVPIAAEVTGAIVYCDPVAADTLMKNGLSPERIHAVSRNGADFNFGTYQARAFHSRHIRFDLPLILRTLGRVGTRFFELRPTLKGYPAGQVLSWRFTIEGRTMHHFGSAGATPHELSRLSSMETDIMMLPLQGHTNICQIALNYVRAVKPQIVIPHHQDDFFPPISQTVDIEPFVSGVEKQYPDTKVLILEMNQTVVI